VIAVFALLLILWLLLHADIAELRDVAIAMAIGAVILWAQTWHRRRAARR
jgi:hypothetical protein